jgi:hypothetical protein
MEGKTALKGELKPYRLAKQGCRIARTSHPDQAREVLIPVGVSIGVAVAIVGTSLIIPSSSSATAISTVRHVALLKEVESGERP